jgi:hypothetical protein
VGRVFPPEARQALLDAGWEIVSVPGILEAPVTLNQLHRRAGDFGARFWTSWHGDFTREDIEYFPLLAGELAWMPSSPLIPDSMGETLTKQEEVVADFSCQVQEQCGDGVEAVFPTAEQAVYLPFDHYRRSGDHILPGRYTRTVNCFGSDRLVVGRFGGGGVVVDDWRPGIRRRFLGVLRLVVPRS